MHDSHLQRLVTALDSVVEWAADGGDHRPDLHHHLEVATLRLKCLSQRLGRPAAESPYLAFVRRLCQEPSLGDAIAASA